jgi:hypothetical protein
MTSSLTNLDDSGDVDALPVLALLAGAAVGVPLALVLAGNATEFDAFRVFAVAVAVVFAF